MRYKYKDVKFVEMGGVQDPKGQIPKPPGEPGCPGRGGYTLNEALDWNPRAYAKFKHQKFMQNLIEEHLDMTKCTSSKDHALLRVVCDKAVDAFLDLENYEGFWLLNDMIMMCLKYTSGHARQRKARMVVGKSKSKKNTLKGYVSSNGMNLLLNSRPRTHS
ncbi:hypothetical protein BDR05DRAFT_948537 [Suillus weaverae]|nr:hypothetical protein BDR05DRAFT_948537 [Suillus weaverae]